MIMIMIMIGNGYRQEGIMNLDYVCGNGKHGHVKCIKYHLQMITVQVAAIYSQ